ncbi:hypothetical protein DM02DRAFT_657805 [Periconia macrospinosa]|uniref:Uncharacterized protein n=1 Tax=Periconia macrospinosa TaxID=97972 RepID=A0A2V1DL92_9PLEO|nr:hypothetical protein DM02DRAFT_657805 [Periconia macrospinosa]
MSPSSNDHANRSGKLQENQEGPRDQASQGSQRGQGSQQGQASQGNLRCPGSQRDPQGHSVPINPSHGTQGHTILITLSHGTQSPNLQRSPTAHHLTRGQVSMGTALLGGTASAGFLES